MNTSTEQSTATDQAVALPPGGGSYDVQPDGSLVKREGTAPANPQLGPDPKPRDY